MTSPIDNRSEVPGRDPSVSSGVPEHLESNVSWAQGLVHGLVGAGVTHAVVSPGSRNTPVLLAIEALRQRGTLDVHLVLDERTAGFLALGLARMTGRPTLLSCTSGSAAANYFPAIVEANQDALPLVILTADRPPERHGVGDGQTMPQRDLYGEHVVASFDPGAPHPAVSRRHPQNLGARVASLAAARGPVHLNLPFRKPLWEPADEERTTRTTPAGPRIVRGPNTLSSAQLGELASRLAAAERGLLVVGPGDLPGPRRDGARNLGGAVQELAARLSWPILVEGSAAVTFATNDHLIRSADLFLRDPTVRDGLRPDLVLRIGQLPTSRPTFEWLASLDCEQLLVDPFGRWNDPDLSASTLLVADPLELCRDLAKRMADSAAGAWAERLRGVEHAARSVLRQQQESAELSGLTVAKAVLSATPSEALIHMASSLAVRDMDSFGGPLAARRMITASRGVNGIDGTIATAFGQHVAEPDSPTLVWLGDLAFLHDIGSLITLSAQYQAPTPFVVLVVDNGGGGIFDHLPIAGHTAFERLFITAQPASNQSRQMGQTVRSTPELVGALNRAFQAPGVHVVVARVERTADLSARRILHQLVGARTRPLVTPEVL